MLIIRWALQGFVKKRIIASMPPDWGFMDCITNSITACEENSLAAYVGPKAIAQRRVGLSATAEGISPELETIHEMFNFYSKQIKKSNLDANSISVGIRLVHTTLLYGLMTIGYGGRTGHYYSLTVDNVKSIQTYLSYKFNPSDEPYITEANKWLHGYYTEYMKNFPEEVDGIKMNKNHEYLCVGVNMLNKKIFGGKMTGKKCNMFPLMNNASILFHKTAACIYYLMTRFDSTKKHRRHLQMIKFMDHIEREDNVMDYLYENKLDPLQILSSSFPNLRFFFLNPKDYTYGDHEANVKRENNHAAYILKLLRDTSEEYNKIRNTNPIPDSSKYSITGVRHMQMENLLQKGLTREQRTLFSNVVFVNSIETQDKVYIKVDQFAKSWRERKWADEGGLIKIGQKLDIPEIKMMIEGLDNLDKKMDLSIGLLQDIHTTIVNQGVTPPLNDVEILPDIVEDESDNESDDECDDESDDESVIDQPADKPILLPPLVSVGTSLWKDSYRANISEVDETGYNLSYEESKRKEHITFDSFNNLISKNKITFGDQQRKRRNIYMESNAKKMRPNKNLMDFVIDIKEFKDFEPPNKLICYQFLTDERQEKLLLKTFKKNIDNEKLLAVDTSTGEIDELELFDTLVTVFAHLKKYETNKYNEYQPYFKTMVEDKEVNDYMLTDNWLKREELINIRL
jgi:hypothetical protein